MRVILQTSNINILKYWANLRRDPREASIRHGGAPAAGRLRTPLPLGHPPSDAPSSVAPETAVRKGVGGRAAGRRAGQSSFHCGLWKKRPQQEVQDPENREKEEIRDFSPLEQILKTTTEFRAATDA